MAIKRHKPEDIVTKLRQVPGHRILWSRGWPNFTRIRFLKACLQKTLTLYWPSIGFSNIYRLLTRIIRAS